MVFPRLRALSGLVGTCLRPNDHLFISLYRVIVSDDDLFHISYPNLLQELLRRLHAKETPWGFTRMVV